MREEPESDPVSTGVDPGLDEAAPAAADAAATQDPVAAATLAAPSAAASEGLFDVKEVIRYLVVGGGGTAIGWLIYELIYFLNPLTSARATSSWLIGYLWGVIQQHWMHRRWTFTDDGPYLSSLGRAYIAYSGGLVASVATNAIITLGLEWHHRIGWVGAVGASVLVNYFALRHYAFGGTSDPADEPR